jgi:hypothetical protein
MMFRLRHGRTGATLLTAALLLSMGMACATRLQRPQAPEEPAVKPPPPVETPDPEPLPPPPSEAELAFDAARRAEMHGDGAAAAALYARAASTTLEAPRRAEALYRLALLRLEPGELRDQALARTDLLQLLDAAPDHPRAREARALLALLDELDAARAQTASARTEAESVKGEVVALRADLEKKDQELKSIKQVLLQRKP